MRGDKGLSVITRKIAYLHNHSKYSESDALPDIIDYKNKIIEMQEKDNVDIVGLAITEHSNLFSYLKHYNINKEVTNAIIGDEIYHCEDRNTADDKDRFHMVLLAKNDEGLKNLCLIATDCGLHKVHGRKKDFMRTDDVFLKNHGKGVIALSACIGGIIPKLLLNGEYDKAKQKALFYNSIFDEFYLEVQPHTIDEQLLVNADLVRMSKETGIGLVITTDTHWINKEDKKYHDILKMVDHLAPFTTECYLYSFDELVEYCKKYDIPLSAITNTVKIAEQCNVNPNSKDAKGLLPNFPVPEGYTEETYLREIAQENLFKNIIKHKYTNIKQRIDRLNYELDIICGAGFSGYFLILWDWFKWCRNNKILLGPGRGSAAGSLVCYVLNITTIDPITNSFIFERFLSRERLEMPDVDTDISKFDRSRGISYLLQRYGKDNVCQIVTFGKYGLKNTIKAAMSALVPDSFDEANAVTKKIPSLIEGNNVDYDYIMKAYNDPDHLGLNQRSISQITMAVEEMEKLFKKYPLVYRAVSSIGGCLKSTGLHAGGVIISSKILKENVPLMEGSSIAVLPVVQIEMSDIDYVKLLKIDVLGLSNLSQIQKCMDLTGLDLDWYDSEDYSDKKVFEILRKGETTDVFQMAGGNATRMLKEMNVDSFDVITVVNAGNRPGPLTKDENTGTSMVDDYIKNKTSGIIPSIHPDIDPILKDTYGCIFYQEQCMQIGMVMAGYTLGGSDKRIRKVLAKKKLKMIPEIKNEFVYGRKSIYDSKGNVIGMSEEKSDYCEGAINRGYDEELAVKIFDKMEDFAKYCFNKSHAGSYAKVGYKTAWLSCYYPVEWAISCMSTYDEQDKINATLNLCKKRGIKILPPTINNPNVDFTVDYENGVKCIRYGFLAIKDVGRNVIEFIKNIVSNHKFTSFDDFYNAVHDQSYISKYSLKQNKNGIKQSPVNKKAETALINVGVFDCFEPNRYKLMNHYMIDIKKDKDYTPYDEKEYKRKDKLRLEKEITGAYLSEHPLEPFPYMDLETCKDGDTVEIAGIVNKTIIKKTKNNKDFATVYAETKSGKEIRALLFKDIEKAKDKLKKNKIIVIYGLYNKKFDNINVIKIKEIRKKSEVIRTANDEDGIEVIDKKPEIVAPVIKNLDTDDFFNQVNTI